MGIESKQFFWICRSLLVGFRVCEEAFFEKIMAAVTYENHFHTPFVGAGAVLS